MSNDILGNLLLAIEGGDEDDLAMAVKLAKLSANAPAQPPLVGAWVVVDFNNDEVYGFPDEQQARSFEQALVAQPGGTAEAYEIKDPSTASSVPASAAATPTSPQQAINFNPATGKYDLDPNAQPPSKLRSGEGGIYQQ